MRDIRSLGTLLELSYVEICVTIREANIAEIGVMTKIHSVPVPTLADYVERADDTAPTISVVTTVRNGARTLDRAIKSVRAQEIPDLEYIVVDACSTDGTHDILRTNGDIVTYWICEPDKGISDGFNKGIALSRGKYVQLLNADDWLSSNQLVQGVGTLEKSGADFVFGDLIYHDRDGKPLYRVRGDANYMRCIGHIMPALNHPTVIVRRSAYEKHGLFDLTLKLAMDYEFLLRLHRKGCRGAYDPEILGHMSLDGASDTASRVALGEVRNVAIRYGGWAALEWARYFFRLAKGDTRRILRNALPAPFYERLRAGLNRDYIRLTP